MAAAAAYVVDTIGDVAPRGFPPLVFTPAPIEGTHEDAIAIGVLAAALVGGVAIAWFVRRRRR